MVALRRGEVDRALAQLSAASQALPDDARVLYALGFAYLGKDMLAFAEQAFRRVLALNPATTALQGLVVQLALRQGNHTLLSRGDEGLSNVAARMAQPIPGTPLRIAAAVPRVDPPLLGLGAIPLLAGAGVFLLLAVVAFRLPRGATSVSKVEDTTPTFAEALRTPADGIEGEDGAAPPATPAAASIVALQSIVSACCSLTPPAAITAGQRTM